MENFWAVDLFVSAISRKLVRFLTTLFKDLLVYIFPVFSNLVLQRILCGIGGFLMVKISNKMFVEKLLAVVALMMTCVGMCGCSEDKVRWHDEFTGAKIVGFINDSLVIIGSYQQRTESHEGLFEPYWDVVEGGHERLCVYNYRVQEDGPRWCDTLGEYNMTNAFRGQMTDSIIWGGDMPNSIRLWKVGESQHQIKLDKKTEGCSGEFGIISVKQWLDGMFIALGENSLNMGGGSCQYALLDTVEKMITYKRLDKNLEWIEKCGDMKACGDDVICLKTDFQKNEIDLFVNGKRSDSLMVLHIPNISSLWKTFEVCFMGNMIYFGHNINSMDLKNHKFLIYPNVKATSSLNFVDENGNNINYEN